MPDPLPTGDAPIVLDSITKLGAEGRGRVVVAASHGGLIAAHLAALQGVRAVILNDAGVGKDAAGIAGLAYCENLGIAAASVSHRSCRIGDGADMAARGTVSHANATATELGVVAGMSCAEAATALRDASLSERPVFPYAEARHELPVSADAPRVVLIDSVSLLEPGDAGAVVVTGSHGQDLAGSTSPAAQVAMRAALFNDAGIGADEAGTSRLPALDANGIAAATVATDSARIGDARSTYEDGVLSRVNATAAAAGGRVGMTCRAFVDGLIEVERT